MLLIMVLVTKSLGLIYKIPLTRMLGGSGMSCYSGAFAVFTPVFAAAAAGAPTAMSRLVSEQLALGKYKNAVRIKRAAEVIFSVVSISLSICLLLCAETLSGSVIRFPQAKWAVIAVSLSLFPAAMMNVERGWAEGLGSMTPTAESEIFETVFKVIAGLSAPALVLRYAAESFELYGGCFGKYCSDMREAMLVSAPYAAAASVLGVSAASFLACIFLFIRNRKLSAQAEREFRYYSLPLDMTFCGAAGNLMRYAVPSSVTAIIATLASAVDLATISPQLKKAMESCPALFSYLNKYGIDPDGIPTFVYGSYTGLALMIFGLIPTFTAMLGKSALPVLSASIAKKKHDETRSGVSSLLFLSSAISIPGGLGICVLSRQLLILFFSGSSAEIAVCVQPLRALGIAAVFMGISLPCLTCLQACSKQTAAVVITLIGTLIKLILNMVLIRIPQINICGAAVSTAVSQFIMCVCAVSALIYYSGCGKKTADRIFVCVLPAVLCAFSALLAQNTLVSKLKFPDSRIPTLISVAIGAIICLFSFALLCISPKKTAKKLFSKKISKST